MEVGVGFAWRRGDDGREEASRRRGAATRVEEEMGEATYGGGGDVIRLEEMGYTIPTGPSKDQ
jgi:hypothetical protein